MNGLPPGEASGHSDPAVELYKLEYEQAASRYENIYKAIWQNFSYLTAISAAVLAFGGDHFQGNLLAVLASLPLVFWFIATFLPLDHYGQQCGDRLADIEGLLNQKYSTELSHFIHFKARKTVKWYHIVKREWWKKQYWRVVIRVRLFFIPLILFFLWQAGLAYSAHRHGQELLVRKKPAEVKLIPMAPEDLKKLIEEAVQGATKK